MDIKWILGGVLLVGLAGGGWYLWTHRPVNQAAARAASRAGLGSRGAEYARTSYGPMQPEAGGGESTWVQDFDTFATGAEKIAGAIDRFV